MFICSFKLNKTKVLSVVAVLCLSLTLIFLMMPESENITTLGTSTITDPNQMVEYLGNLGYTVAPEPILVEDVTIPEKFDDEYLKYNDLQKEGGLNLEKYAGKDAKKYTFKVLLDDPNADEVVVNLLVSEDKIIGGDVSSTKLGGFMKSLFQKSNE